jgi:histidine triad (HIT) family protein
VSDDSSAAAGSATSRATSDRRDPACLFCRIEAGEIPSTRVAEDELVVAFRDINPRAPTHVLVMPREHIRSAAELTDADAPLVGHLLAVAAEIARSEGVAEKGYRIVTNVGDWGGQSVDHLHFHVMGGRALGALG